MDLEQFELQPFDLEKCIAGSKVVLKDGRPFIFGAYNKQILDYPVIGWVEELSGRMKGHTFTVDGHFNIGVPHVYDLYILAEKPIVHKRYVIVRPSSGFTTLEAAQNYAGIFHKEEGTLIAEVEFTMPPGSGSEKVPKSKYGGILKNSQDQTT